MINTWVSAVILKVDKSSSLETASLHFQYIRPLLVESIPLAAQEHDLHGEGESGTIEKLAWATEKMQKDCMEQSLPICIPGQFNANYSKLCDIKLSEVSNCSDLL